MHCSKKKKKKKEQGQKGICLMESLAMEEERWDRDLVLFTASSPTGNRC